MSIGINSTLSPEIIEQALSYGSYNRRVNELYARNETTSGDNREVMLQYTRLNLQRTNRIEKRGSIIPEARVAVKANKAAQIWLVITEGWCGDSAQILPYLNKMSDLNPRISLKIVLRDEQPELMDKFLTNGSRSIPKLIVLEAETLEVLAEWGPRPKEAQNLYVAERSDAEIGAKKADQNLHLWYAKDKGKSTQHEIAELLNRL